MIDKLIKKYKEQMNENYDEDNKYADLSKALAYQEILKDLEELKRALEIKIEVVKQQPSDNKELDLYWIEYLNQIIGVDKDE